jgi:GR25 family glycosyltransferase involved in LPS biosynthesis
VKVYVINLENRVDRWQQVLEQLDKIGFDVDRIDAVKSDLIDSKVATFASPSVIAIWKSHQKAMTEFLKSEAAHALILEDDFYLKTDLKFLLSRIYYSEEVDFIQLGYLYTSPMQFLSVKIMNMINTFLRLAEVATHIRFMPAARLRSKKLVTENHEVPFHLIPNDIRAGAHAYLVSRKFAQSMQLFNSPTYLSTDGLYMALGWNRTFRMYRTRKNYVRQSNSISSVYFRTMN